MRVTSVALPSLVLLFLPWLVAYNGLGVIATTLIMLAWMAFRFFITMRNVESRQHDNRLVLHTMSLSHYVEKVRWSMQRIGIQFEEEQDVGILGVFMFGRMVPCLWVPTHDTKIFNSSDILRYLYGQHAKDEIKGPFLEPTYEAVELEKKIDQMGDDLRRFVYYNSFISPKGDELLLQIWGSNNEKIPQWQRLIVKVIYKFFRSGLEAGLNVTPNGSADGIAKSKAFFKEIDDLLSDGRKFLLDTEEPTFVDVSLASLAAILLFPDNYGGLSTFGPEQRVRGEDFGPEFEKESQAFRNTPTGKFVLKMYKEFR